MTRFWPLGAALLAAQGCGAGDTGESDEARGPVETPVVRPQAADDPISVVEEARLRSSDAQYNTLGQAVALSGDTALVGAPDEKGTGAAYVFVRAGSTWSEQTKLLQSDGTPNASFGVSVALSGETAIVAAAASGTGVTQGTAYSFLRSGSSWSEQGKVLAHGASGFGPLALALSGDTAVVGDPDDGEKGAGVGAAYVFVRSGSTWTQQAKLFPSDATTHDSFGRAVAVSGDTAIVGATHDGDPAAGDAAAYVFVRSGSSWSEQQKLTSSMQPPPAFFAVALALEGDTAIVGSPERGAAVVFVRSGSSWSEQTTLAASDGAQDDHFGRAVALSGSTLLVGASGHDAAGADAGAAYVFARSGSTWSQQAKLVASAGAEADGPAGDALGLAVAVSGETALVGAPRTSVESGSAFVFRWGSGAGTDATTAGGGETTSSEEGGCSCRAGAPEPSASPVGLALALLGTRLLRRRRRSQRRQIARSGVGAM